MILLADSSKQSVELELQHAVVLLLITIAITVLITIVMQNSEVRIAAAVPSKYRILEINENSYPVFISSIIAVMHQ
jgi:hypothetical protein